MPKKIKFVKNPKADELFKKIALEQVNKNGLDLECPGCRNRIHISFSGDTCKFCGLTINYGTDPQI